MRMHAGTNAHAHLWQLIPSSNRSEFHACVQSYHMPTTELLILLVTQLLRHVRPLLHLVSACRERGKVQPTDQAWYKGAAVVSPVSVKSHGACIAGIHHQLHIYQDKHGQHACK